MEALGVRAMRDFSMSKNDVAKVFWLTDLSGSLTDGPVNYKYKTKCTWLIEGYPNAVLRLRFNHFATECSWDHMYVYDGDSIYSPLIAVFSGLIVPESRSNDTVPEVVTTSGYALLHFFSDAAYNLTGFNVAYSINSCPNNCSGHGRCSPANSASGRVYCECDSYWKGESCNIPYCKNDCGSPDHGYCDLTGEKLCVCNDSWQGPDCSLSVPSTEAFWVLPSVKPSAQSSGRASHQALVHSGLMWVVGGYSFNYSNYHMVLNYNFDTSTWDAVPTSSGPTYRYGHSLTLYQDDIFMFGGKLEVKSANVTHELWVFNIPGRTWSLRTPALPPPYALEGHTAHVVALADGEAAMLTFFGYSPLYSYVNKVQEYNIRSNTWQVVSAGGAVVQGGYGHSSVYDQASGCVFVHGGYKALGSNKYGLLAISGPSSPDLVCTEMPTVLVILPWLATDSSEEQCFRFSDCASCTANTRSCQWCEDRKCISASSNCTVLTLELAQQHGGALSLSPPPSMLSGHQLSLWKHGARRRGHRLSPWVGLRKINVSYWAWEDTSPFTNTSLRWLPGEPSDSGFCAYLERAQVAGLKANPCTSTTDGLICEKPIGPKSPSARPCKTPCSLRTSCANCTSQPTECMWCSSTQRCVDSSAYVISFPYGQCLEWQTKDCTAQNCSGLRTCAECLERAECGWCGDPTNTGKGICVEGSYRGPMKTAAARAGQRVRDKDMLLDQSLCSSDRGYNWAFIQCPACQCNGHSRCVNGSVCEHCGNLTSGTHCQNCMPGYYGDPINGGKCNACKCNNHANVCQSNTGKCFCTTKGIKGDHCQLCDSENRYLGNPLRGTCYCKSPANSTPESKS
ncbi:unnamed protein product [Tetraodon nigroviridis]|uniref:(spotted green pufferfish) hypothetical protein n=1 Tax=Tetraodon nigroviridis TaxID=99883 RepID=Q4SG86_TETNG|nr:unnamed protein product [Tetraodon nigroviridis]